MMSYLIILNVFQIYLMYLLLNLLEEITQLLNKLTDDDIKIVKRDIIEL